MIFSIFFPAVPKVYFIFSIVFLPAFPSLLSIASTFLLPPALSPWTHSFWSFFPSPFEEIRAVPSSFSKTQFSQHPKAFGSFLIFSSCYQYLFVCPTAVFAELLTSYSQKYMVYVIVVMIGLESRKRKAFVLDAVLPVLNFFLSLFVNFWNNWLDGGLIKLIMRKQCIQVDLLIWYWPLPIVHLLSNNLAII